MPEELLKRRAVARHDTLKQQHDCRGNFTAQRFHTSATSRFQLWTLRRLCVFIYFVSVSKDARSRAVRNLSQMSRAKRCVKRRHEESEGARRRKVTVGGCTLISARRLRLFKRAPLFTSAKHPRGQIKRTDALTGSLDCEWKSSVHCKLLPKSYDGTVTSRLHLNIRKSCVSQSSCEHQYFTWFDYWGYPRDQCWVQCWVH